MARRRIDWHKQIGRRINLRDLHIFLAVTRCGIMAKAAAQLGVSQPTVSQAIAGIEYAYGVRLLDRSPHGIEPTLYGNTLIRRSIAVFDELQQSGRDIDHLADPTSGELRIGFQESVGAALLGPIIRRFSEKFPGVTLHLDDLPSAAFQLSQLRARRYDLILALLTRSLDDEDLHVEVLLNDRVAVACNIQSRWARRREIKLNELAEEPWILTPPDTWAYARVAEAFTAQGLAMPKAHLVTMSVPLRAYLVSNGKYISTFARSTLRAIAPTFRLKVVSVDLHDRAWPAVIIMLKHRTLSPLVERFIECARTVAGSIAGKATSENH